MSGNNGCITSVVPRGALAELFATAEMQRLEGVSHGAVARNCESKLRHSVCVWNGTKASCCKQLIPRCLTVNLELAALLHDVGTPPFSHLSEEFYLQRCGKNHEDIAAEIILGSLAGVVRKCGADPQTVADMVCGRFPPPYGLLIKGDCDVDSIFGMMGFVRSRGLLNGVRYDPLTLACELRICGNKLAIHESAWGEYLKWREFRDYMFREIIRSDNDLVPWAMLYRAIELADCEGLIRESFFRMTDNEALDHLLHCGSRGAACIVRNLNARRMFQKDIWRNASPELVPSNICQLRQLAQARGYAPCQYAISVRRCTRYKPMMPKLLCSGSIDYSRTNDRHDRSVLVQLFSDPDFIPPWRLRR